jgi:glycosyltransferase involved in cell wall biosynthesis
MQTNLVSIVIASYNSSQFIVETLNSISKQTWNEIELIITDDNSTDDTVEVCHSWLQDNKYRFSNSALITSDKNTGVTVNANRGLHVANGHWIKLLGADDTLKPDCIENNMLWIRAHNDIKILFSRVEVFKDFFEPENILKIIPDIPLNSGSIMASERSAKSQYKMLLICDRIHFTPSVFMHREILDSAGYLDERFRMMEDYPLWLNLTRKGVKLHFMDKVTVNYRMHSNAINNTGISYLINPNYFKTEHFRRVYTYPNLPLDIRLNQRYYWYISQLFRFKWLSRNSASNRLFLGLLTIYLNPFKYVIWFRKRMNKSLRNDEFYL